VALAGGDGKSIRALGGVVEPRRYGSSSIYIDDTILPNLEYADLRESDWKVVEERWFCRLEKLRHVELPLEVERISDCVFSFNAALAEMWFPRGLKVLGVSAFYGCSALKEVSFPTGFETLSEYSFAWCSSLRRVVLPAAIKSIWPNAFFNCAALETLTVGDVEEWEVDPEERGSALDISGALRLKEIRLIGQRWETLPEDDILHCLAPDARVVGANFVGKKFAVFVVQRE
jgi:hypothetical protein